MGKLSSYQKLKKRVAELEKDLETIVLYPESVNALMIKEQVKFAHDKDIQMMMGIYGDLQVANGILTHVQNG